MQGRPGGLSMEREVKFRINEELYNKVKEYAEKHNMTLKEFFVKASELMLNFDVDRIAVEVIEKESKLDGKLRKQLMNILEQIRTLKLYKKHLLEEIEKLEIKIMYRKRALKVLYRLEDYMRTLDLMIQIPETIGKENIQDVKEIIRQLKTIYNSLMYHIEILTEIIKKRKRRTVKKEEALLHEQRQRG